jgi:[acyl-carrier-protein] S-malonyltransferase
MQQAAEKLKTRLAELALAVPQIPVLNNVDVAQLADPLAISDALVRQAASPVRWVEIMQAMQAAGVTHVFECGPGKVLSGLVKRCVDGIDGAAMNDLAGIDAALAVVSRQGIPSPARPGI